MSDRIETYRFPLEQPDGSVYPVLELADALAGLARVHFVVEVDGPNFVAAVAGAGDASRAAVAAGLPPLHFRDGVTGCPACGKPQDDEGTPETDEQGQLEL